MKTFVKVLAAVTVALSSPLALAHNGGGGGRGGIGHFSGGGFGHFSGGHRGYFRGHPYGFFGYGFYPFGWDDYGPYYGPPYYSNSSAIADTHSLIADVQGELSSRGFYSGAIDGIPGPATRDAVRRFQAKHGFPVTGMIDSKLLRALGLE